MDVQRTRKERKSESKSLKWEKEALNKSDLSNLLELSVKNYKTNQSSALIGFYCLKNTLFRKNSESE